MTNLELKQSAHRFQTYLDDFKVVLNEEFEEKINWYPYSTLANFNHLECLLGEQFNLVELMGSSVADIGGSDGDLSFFIEQLGIRSDLVENPKTQHNGLKGAKLLKERLFSNVNLVETNINNYFELENTYDLVFFLGILYHLQNPYNAMLCIKKYSKYCILSTRIASWAHDIHDSNKKTYIGNLPVSYLLGGRECNNDPTNYWIFSRTGLERLLNRTGWEILASRCFGDTENSNPRDLNHDERYFCLLRNKHQELLIKPN